jgi:DNA-binding NarL/FixJ family response regulator
VRPPTTHILVADDHPLFREALRHVINASFLACEITEVRSFAETLRAATQELPFDLVFVDLIMPGSSDPLADLEKLRAAMPSTPILVVSARDDRETVEGVLARGAAAFIAKSATKPEMEQAIRSVLAGDVYRPADASAAGPAGEPVSALSPRQTAVLELLARGRSNRQIAGDLNVEEFTVKAHISAILRKLHVKSRLEAVVVSRSILDRR